MKHEAWWPYMRLRTQSSLLWAAFLVIILFAFASFLLFLLFFSTLSRFIKVNEPGGFLLDHFLSPCPSCSFGSALPLDWALLGGGTEGEGLKKGPPLLVFCLLEHRSDKNTPNKRANTATIGMYASVKKYANLIDDLDLYTILGLLTSYSRNDILRSIERCAKKHQSHRFNWRNSVDFICMENKIGRVVNHLQIYIYDRSFK